MMDYQKMWFELKGWLLKQQKAGIFPERTLKAMNNIEVEECVRCDFFANHEQGEPEPEETDREENTQEKSPDIEDHRKMAIEIMEAITGFKHVGSLAELKMEIRKAVENPKGKRPLAISVKLNVPSDVLAEAEENGVMIVRYGMDIGRYSGRIII